MPKSFDSSADALAHIRSVPGCAIIGTQVQFVPSTGSTNDDLKALARAGAIEGLVLLTDEQTAGRGRRGRTWQAPAGTSLLQSVLLRPTWLTAAEGFLLTMLAAVAAAEAIEQLANLRIGLKWPNDLQYNGAKLGGILIEAELRDTTLLWAVIGIGLNVNWNPTTLPELAARATSLAAIVGQPIDRAALFTALMQRLDHWYALLHHGAQTALRTAWRDRLTTLNQIVQADTPHGPLIGTTEDVDTTGALVIRTADGTRHTLHAGEVSVRTT